MGTPEQWFTTHSFHHRQFADTTLLCRRKQAQGVRLSLGIPTRNEAQTITPLLERLLPLRDELLLVDEIAVIDSGSTDRTRELAAAAGADVYLAADILPQYGNCVGKGENLWKAVHQLHGDILVFIDGDVTSLHPGFVTGLIGPLLTDASIGYVKGCYDRPAGDRPLDPSPQSAADGGGRLTEILARPLLSLWYPQLSGLIQPLAGEFAARRSVLERIPFPVGYGVELAHLLDLVELHGLTVFAQTDLGWRCHRHRSNRQLGQSAHGLLQVLQRRLQRRGILGDQTQEVPGLRQFIRHGGQWRPEEVGHIEQERPPLISLAEYQLRHHPMTGCPANSGLTLLVEE